MCGEGRRRALSPIVHYISPMADDPILDDELGLEIHHASTLSPGAANAVAMAAKWGKYYLYIILAYFVISFGFQLVAFAGVGAAAGGLGGDAAAGAAVGLAPLVSVVIFSLLLYAYPVIKFWGFTHDTPGALAAASQPAFTGAIDKLRSVYKYIGIFLIVILGIYALLFIGLLLFGGLAALTG